MVVEDCSDFSMESIMSGDLMYAGRAVSGSRQRKTGQAEYRFEKGLGRN
jgi:hypothetical protein